MRVSDRTFQWTTLVDILIDRSRHQPEQIAYTFLLDGESQEACLTYRSLDQQARSIAAHLRSLCPPGERALLLYPPGLAYIAAFFGCLYAGVVAVPAYPPERDRSLARTQAILTDAKPKIALTIDSVLTKLEPKLAQIPEFRTLKWLAIDRILEESQVPTEQAEPEPSVMAESLAFLQYTSGSTAAPKGVMISHANLLHNLSAIHRAFNHTIHSQGVIWLPPYHDMGLIGGILQPLYGGFPVVLMPPLRFMQSPMRWLKAISRYRATTSGAPSFAYDQCVSKFRSQPLTDLDLSSWEVAFNGAEPVQLETLERFAATFEPYGFRRLAFLPCYGLAEATLIVSGSRKNGAIASQIVDKVALSQNQVVSGNFPSVLSQTLVSCGESLPDQQIRIVHPETGVPCAADEVGEIWVSGASVAQGYWHQAEETERFFCANLKDQVGEKDGTASRFLRTGDLGFLKNGELFVTGRLKDLIIIRGQNHYPQDIELTVQASHSTLASGSGAAFSVTVNSAEQLVIAQEIERHFLRQLDADAAFQAIFQSITRAVAEQHELQVYAIALLKPGSLPKTSSGKIQRYACRAHFLAETLEVVASWTTNLAIDSEPLTSESQSSFQATARTEIEIQTWLINSLSLYLKVEPAAIDVSLPFAYYGLDSSVAVSITGELAQWLGLDQLDPTLFWEYPSIEALAQHLGTESD
jgi:acyl-CoA synthetase (AMP-forming)/AMP-acid ligase II/acyl carrier protein